MAITWRDIDQVIASQQQAVLYRRSFEDFCRPPLTDSAFGPTAYTAVGTLSATSASAASSVSTFAPGLWAFSLR